MKIIVLACMALGLMACSKEEAPSGGAKTEAKSGDAPKAAAAAQKGLEGKEVVGYLKDPQDEGICVILTAKSKEEAASMTKEKVEEVAKMMKAEVTDGCKTEGVVGSCFAMGMLQNYYGPKYTKESATAGCEKDHGKWIE